MRYEKALDATFMQHFGLMCNNFSIQRPYWAQINGLSLWLIIGNLLGSNFNLGRGMLCV